jgi:hypothetical protein
LANHMQRFRPMYPSMELHHASVPKGNEWIVPTEIAPPDGDQSLVDSVLRGRTDAFADLVTPHLGSLTRLARIRLRDASEVEDVVQQAVLRAFHNLAQFRREASFKTWLSKITSNEVIHVVRRGKAIANFKPLQSAAADRLADPANLQDLQIERKERTPTVAPSAHAAPGKISFYHRVARPSRAECRGHCALIIADGRRCEDPP